MHPEDHLDQLIDHYQATSSFPDPIEPDVAETVPVIEAFSRLHSVSIPTEFTQRLRTRLEEHLANQSDSPTIRVPSPPVRLPRHVRLWQIAATILVMSVVMFIGVTNAAAAALPGNPFYSVKQWQQSLAYAQARDDNDRSKIALQNARTSLHDLQDCVIQQTSDTTIREALTTLANQTQRAQNAVQAIHAQDMNAARQSELTELLAQEDQKIRSFFGRVDWRTRAALTTYLGVLGDAIPRISHVQLESDSELTVDGEGFDTNAVFMLDGQIISGSLVRSTSTHVEVTIHVGQGDHTLGVVNPDGTVALIDISIGSMQSGSDKNKYTPIPTPEHQGDEGTDGKGGAQPTPSSPSGSDQSGKNPTAQPSNGNHDGSSASLTPTPESGKKQGGDQTPTPTNTPHP